MINRLSYHCKQSCLLMIAGLLTLLFASQSFAQTTIIRAGAIVDPASGIFTPNQMILIEKNEIKAIGPNLPIPKDAKVIDLSTRTVLPGLMDAHTHLLASVDPKWDLGSFWTMALQRREGYRAILGVKHAKEVLEAGFTTVRDVGNSGLYLDMDLEKSIRFGNIPGPTIIGAGRIIAPFGGQFWETPTNPEHLKNPEYFFADSRDEMRKAVRENIYWGAKVIKIVVDPGRFRYSTEDIQFMVAEAATSGVKIAAHVQTAEGARNAIEAKVASLEHAWFISDEDLALAKKNGVVLVSTDFTVFQQIQNGMTDEAAKRSHARMVERLKRAYKAGVTIVFGTDIMNHRGDVSRGVQALEYIDSFKEAGVPAPEILRAMTSNAAALLGVDKKRGALKPGLAADIIAVAGDPLKEIDVLKKVSFVMRNGVVHRHDMMK
jgi:imidazolonepropionase-like amidohydrolase